MVSVLVSLFVASSSFSFLPSSSSPPSSAPFLSRVSKNTFSYPSEKGQKGCTEGDEVYEENRSWVSELSKSWNCFKGYLLLVSHFALFSASRIRLSSFRSSISSLFLSRFATWKEETEVPFLELHATSFHSWMVGVKKLLCQWTRDSVLEEGDKRNRR